MIFPTDPYGLDDLLVAIGILVVCLGAGYCLLEIGGWFSRRHDKDR